MNFLNDIDLDENCYNDIIENNNCNMFNVTSINSEFQNSSSTNLNILCFNIRSFNKNIDEFLVFIDKLKLQFDVMILTETWLSPSTVSLGCLDGYQCFHSFRSNKNSGGVSVFIRDEFQCFERQILNNDIIEAIAVDMKISKNEIVNVIGIYRPPSGSIRTFNDHLDNFFNDIKLKSNSCIVGGDFNICLFRSDSDVQTSSFLNLMHSFSLLPLINLPTRVTDNSKSLIDNLWSNIMSPSRSGVIDVNITDHYPIFSVFDKAKCEINDIVKVFFRDFSINNINRFREELASQDLLSEVDDINLMTEFFLSQFNYLYKKCFPIKIKNIGVKRLKKPWLTKAILKSIDMKNSLYKLVKASACSKAYYNKYRNSLTSLLRNSKKLYF